MDWQPILTVLTVGRLQKLARNAGLLGLGRKRKAQLVNALAEVLDADLKRETLMLLRADELRRLVARSDLTSSDARRNRDLVQLLLVADRDEGTEELGGEDLLVVDRGRFDVPPGQDWARGVEPLPSRPRRPDQLLFFEVQELMRRPHLSRAVLAVPSCDSALLQRLLGEGLDDLIESAVRFRPQQRGDRATVSVVLADRASLDGDAGRALVALAQQLEGKLEIRLLHDTLRLTSSVLAFEEMLPGGPHLTAIVGSPSLSLSETRDERTEVAAHVRLSAPTDAATTPSSVVKEWLRHLLRGSRALLGDDLQALPGHHWVVDKVRYKRRFDTAHELRLKHLAEHTCRRGRGGLPPFDPSAVSPLLLHQRQHLARAAQPWRRGVLLCDDSGVGKTVTAAFIVARELRRARVLASERDQLARRALVIAPQSLHAGWCDEFGTKLGLPVTRIPPGVSAAQLFDPSQGRRVTICTPATVREHWEALSGFEVVAVAEAHLFEERALSAVSGIANAAQFCIVTSSHPAQHDIADVFGLAGLAEPAWRWDTLTELSDDEAHLSAELRAVARRTQRGQLLSEGTIVTREWVDRQVDLDAARASAYRALRQLRFDYQHRGDRTTAWAFIALERAFLSSLSAFRSAVSWTLDRRRLGGALHECFEEHGDSDGSLSFLRSSSYFQRRLRTVDSVVEAALFSDAVISGKEAALLDVLRGHAGKAVVVFCGFRATQQRLASVLARGKQAARVDILDGSSSPRERMAVIERFSASVKVRSTTDGAAGVLLCTDEAATGIRLFDCAAAGVNYDIPYNPQTIEWRIRRLQCVGQRQPVHFTSLAQRDPAADGWTMDTRVIHCCRQLFDMADASGAISDSLIELDPDDMVVQLSGRENGEISLLQEPDPSVAAQMDKLLIAPLSEEERAAGDALADWETRYRAQISDFWARVSYGAGDMAGSRGYLFDRLRLALLQGQCGALCAPGRKPEDCYTYHLAVGLRLMVEAAVGPTGRQLNDDDWLIEDEQVYLWAVAPDGALVDWSGFLMGGGLAEVPHERVVKLVGPEVVDYLATLKQHMESHDLDGMDLRQWREQAPEGVAEKIKIAYRQADTLVHGRIRELTGQWDARQQARRALLTARHQCAIAHDLPEVAADIAQLISRLDKRRVQLRPTIVGTQLFLVMH